MRQKFEVLLKISNLRNRRITWNTDSWMQSEWLKLKLKLNLKIICNRRQRREKEIANLASGINFQYTSPFMSDSHSLVKQQSQTTD